MPNRISNILGMTFGKLKVISMAERRIPNHMIFWNCQCECGNESVVCGSDLRCGKIGACLECGRLIQAEKLKKYNEYILENNFVVGIPNNKKDYEFIIDHKYYNTIKNYCWRLNSKGYICTQIKRKEVKIHRFIMELELGRELETKEFIDHDDRNPLINLISNLRLCTQDNNAKNRKVAKNSKTGVSGVTFYKNSNNEIIYLASINKENNKASKVLSTKIFEDAVIARLYAEKEFYGEFAPQRHLFKEYGIE